MAHKPYGALRAQMSPAAQAQAAQQADAMLRAMPDPTPGEVAYTAYWFARNPHARHRWRDLRPADQAAWEAAAQAVRESQAVLCPICAAELERCNATEDPDHA